jgi:hypothetical protein
MTTNLHTEFGPRIGAQPFEDAAISRSGDDRSASYLVREVVREVARTTKPNGQHPEEVRRLSEATHFIERRGRSAFVTIESEIEIDAPDDTVRGVADKVKNHIVTFQRRNGCPAYWVEVLEPRPRLHVHLIAAAPDRRLRSMIDSLSSSSLFGERLEAKRVYDMTGLAHYLSKLATPQAHYAAGFAFRRVPGSHRMEGDRVRLSRELERDLIDRGSIRPFARTYARRLPKAPALLAEIEVRYRDNLFDDQPLPVLSAPQRPTTPTTPPRKRQKIEPPSLQMDYPPTVADLLAGLGPTHEAIAERVGLSRPQVTNVIVGRFGVSRPVARRVLELALAA